MKTICKFVKTCDELIKRQRSIPTVHAIYANNLGENSPLEIQFQIAIWSLPKRYVLFENFLNNGLKIKDISIRHLKYLMIDVAGKKVLKT